MSLKHQQNHSQNVDRECLNPYNQSLVAVVLWHLSSNAHKPNLLDNFDIHFNVCLPTRYADLSSTNLFPTRLPGPPPHIPFLLSRSRRSPFFSRSPYQANIA